MGKNLSLDEFYKPKWHKLKEWLQNVFQKEKLEIVQLLTYESVIQYFITDRPTNPNIRKGAILREPHPQGYFLAQLFLDDNNQIINNPEGEPYARYIVAQELDEELLDSFDDNDLIIVE